MKITLLIMVAADILLHLSELVTGKPLYWFKSRNTYNAVWTIYWGIAFILLLNI